jgi:P-type Cu+ transporter
MKSIDLHIEGMTCAACSTRIEKVLNKLPGVTASVSLLEHRARITGLGPDDAIAAIRRAGYDAWPVEAAGSRRNDRQAGQRANTLSQTLSRAEQFRLWLSILALPPMVVEMAGMLSGHGHLIPLGIQWALATVMQTFVAWPFYRSAWRALKAGSANMETLITLGTGSAYLWSVAAWWSQGITTHDNTGMVFYFETSIVVLAMVRIGRHLEQTARQQALDAISKLAQLDSAPVERWENGRWAFVVPDQVMVGDTVRLAPNQAIQLDAVIAEGQTEIDESSMTGESLPAARAAGEMIFAGCRNLSGTITATVSQPFHQSRRAKIGERILNALSSRAPIAAMADRIAGIFVPVVLVIAAATFLGHWLIASNSAQALANAVAVLVVACPCALGLATPAAIATGLARAAQFGWLFRSADALQRAADINHVVFDKTGTLTSGRAMLIALADQTDPSAELNGTLQPEAGRHDRIRVMTLDKKNVETPWPQWLADAAGAERGIEHPLAGALLSYAAGRSITDCRDVHNTPGKGVTAVTQTSPPREVRVGRPGWASTPPAEVEPLHADASAVDVTVDQQWMGRVWVADTLRPDASASLALLQTNDISASILSGDRTSAVARVARLLGDIAFSGEQSPEAKAHQLDAWRAEGKKVAMVGDGINDAAAMAHAHLGIAMASGATMTLETADLTISNTTPLLSSAQSLLLARSVLRRVKENLVFAFGFNALAIPLAAMGGLTPVIAGSAMALSSAAVMMNAMRLLGWSPKSLS